MEPGGAIINLGVAAHITAAAPGGPRYDGDLQAGERNASGNGIWLCQNCGHLIDSDTHRFSAPLLRTWKADAELEAFRRLGKAGVGSDWKSAKKAELQLKRDLKLRDKMQRDFLRPPSERAGTRARMPVEKFKNANVVIRDIDAHTYPNLDADDRRPSTWFKPEVYDFYHNGLMVIVGIYRGVIDADGHWRILQDTAVFDTAIFHEVHVLHLGKIPWRNIKHYDMEGDEYYTCPHIYCSYADNSSPYEGYAFAWVGETYTWSLDETELLPAEAILPTDIREQNQDPNCC